MSTTYPSKRAFRKSRFAVTLGLASLVLTAFLIVLLHAYFSERREKETQAAVANSLAIWENDYQTSLLHREEMSLFIMDEFRRIPGLTSLLANYLSTSSAASRALIRGRIAALCQPLYDNLTRIGIKQVHFHTPESESLLRMHRPERFGDSLKGYVPASSRSMPPLNLSRASRREGFSTVSGMSTPFFMRGCMSVPSRPAFQPGGC